MQLKTMAMKQRTTPIDTVAEKKFGVGEFSGAVV